MHTSVTSLTGKVLDPLAVLQHVGVSSGMKIADFGCGHGHFIYPAAQLVGPRGSVYAVDLQHELLHALESQAKSQGIINVRTVWADLEKFSSTKIPNGIIDVVLLVNNHVDAATQAKFLREAVRILKRGGTVVLIDWLGGNTVPFAPAIVEQVSKETALVQAAALGLTLVDEFRPGRYHYGLRLQKA